MGTNTNAPMVMGIMGYYVIITVLLGLFGSSYQATTVIGQPTAPDTITFLGSIGYFIAGLTFTITSLPLWVTTILFLPPAIALLYIILSWLRGSS